MSDFIDKYCEFPSFMRRPMWRIWHKLLMLFDKDSEVNFMNYGFKELNGDPVPNLEKADEKNRYCIQLYQHVVQGIILRGKSVIEIGSGRGGGADYISRYHKPSKYTGIDISREVIKFCNEFYNVPGLSFTKGRAEKIPFANSSFDTAINIESARCYSDIGIFFKEVSRILKPAGSFLFADMIGKNEVADIRDKLKKNGFHINSEKNITKNVAKGLESDHPRRAGLIKSKIPGSLKASFSSFAGTKGTKRFDSFRNGKFEYWSFVLSKAGMNI